jgi:sugar fermentation stimulation protein A
VAGTFLDRPNRFLAVVDVGGKEVYAHVADPGRLKELLRPGARVYLMPTPGPERATDHTVILARAPTPPRVWVCVDSMMANRLAAHVLENSLVRGLIGKWNIRREVTVGHSRFDFQLKRGKRTVFVEVKSVTLARKNTALFPDAPTVRGARHLRELAELAEAGQGAAVLFCAGRDDVARVRPHRVMDPDFAEAAADARAAGVKFYAVRFKFSRRGGVFAGRIPVVI